MAIAKKKQSPLRAALDNERGRNYGLEKQRKSEKQAAKRKGLPPPLPKGEAKKAAKRAAALEAEEEAVIESDDDEDEGAEDNVELESGSVSDDEDEGDADGKTGGLSLAEQIRKLAEAAALADPDRKRGSKGVAVDEEEDEELEDEEDEDEEIDDDDDEDDEVNGGAALQPANLATHMNGALPAADSESDIPLSDLASDDEDEDLIPHQRLTINNTAALTTSLSRIALPTSSMPFSQHLSITAPTPTQIPDANDDLNRELSLYAQSLHAVQTARPLLLSENVPFSRPSDYFAEMVKSDEHMGKIRARAVDEAARKKASQDARRLRDAKKFGKAVQNEKLKERAAAKRAVLEGVAGLKRKRGAQGVEGAGEGLFDVALEEAVAGGKERKGRGEGGRSTKRVKKDEKFGFGGKKRHAKSNDAVSSGDVRGFSRGKSGGGGRGGKTGAAKRPGKARRAKGKP